jgi:aspartyl protease family protein
MDSDSLARLIYLVLLGAAITGWFLAENRASMGKNVRMALAWGMIFLGMMAGYGLWQDVRSDVLPRQAVIEDGGAIEVPRGADGHFHLTLRINGEPVEFLVDTGASDLVLTMEDARRVGLDPENLAFIGSANTANGRVRTAFTTLDEVALGPATFRDVGAAVNGGEMKGSLLGMSFLRRFDRLEISDGKLKLEL